MSAECQAFEELLSAHLDAELPPEEAVAALEHALRCASCRAFYDGSRRLEAALAPTDESGGIDPTGPTAEGGASLPERLWARVRRESGWAGAGRRAGRGLPGARWILGLAAGVAAAVALWLALGVGREISPAARQALRPESGAVTEEPAAEPRSMTDERFVAMTRELLASDPRYLRAMQGVLREASTPSEGGSGEDQPVRGEGFGLLPPRGAV